MESLTMDTSLSSPPDSLSSTDTVDEPLAALLEFSPLASNVERSLNTKIHGPYGIEPLRKVWSRNDFSEMERVAAVKQTHIDDYSTIVPPQSLFNVQRGRALGASAPYTTMETGKTAPFHSFAYPVYHLRAYYKQQAYRFDAVYATLGGVLHRGSLHRAQWALPNESPATSMMYLYGQRYRNNRPVFDHRLGSPPEKVPSVIFVIQKEQKRNFSLHKQHIDSNPIQSRPLHHMKTKVIGLKPAQPLILSSVSSEYSTSPSVQTPHFVQTIEEQLENPRRTIDSNDVAAMFRNFYGESESEQSGSTVTILDATSNETLNKNAPPAHFYLRPIARKPTLPMMSTNKVLLQLRNPNTHPTSRLDNNKSWDNGDYKIEGKRWDAPYSTTTSPNMTTLHFDVEEEFVDFNNLCFSQSGSLIVPPKAQVYANLGEPLLLDGLRLGDAPLSSTQIGTSVQPLRQSTQIEGRLFHNAHKQLDSRIRPQNALGITTTCSPTSKTLTRAGTKIINETQYTENAFVYIKKPASVLPDYLQTTRAIAVEVAKVEDGGAISDPGESTDLFTMPELKDESTSDASTRSAYPAGIDFAPQRSFRDMLSHNGREKLVHRFSDDGSLSSTTLAFAESQYATSTWDSLTSGFESGYVPSTPMSSRLTQSGQSVIARPKCPPLVGSHSHTLASVSDVFHTIALDETLKRENDEYDDAIFVYKSQSAPGLTSFEERVDSNHRHFAGSPLPNLFTYVIFKLFPMWIKVLSCRSRRVRNREESMSSSKRED